MLILIFQEITYSNKTINENQELSNLYIASLADLKSMQSHLQSFGIFDK